MSLWLMEEHLQAYFVWKAQGIRGAWCWHLDAHLDIGKTGLSEQRLEFLQDCGSVAEVEAQVALGNSYLPWGGLHCGNYLYPAIREGLVSRLTWVIPPYLPEGKLLSWARRHLNEWFDLSLREYSSLRVEGQRVVGELLGISFEMGTLEAVEKPTEPVLLDVDLDYLLTDEGSVWREAAEVVSVLESVPSEVVTVAYSVKGGFTPQEQRRLAQPFVDRWGAAQDCGEETHCWNDLDSLAALVRCHRYAEAVEAAEALSRSVEVEFLRGTALQALERKEEVLGLWQALLGEPGLPPDGQAYLHGLVAEICNSLGRPGPALEHSRAAQKLDPGGFRHLWNEALAREGLGEDRKALKALRRLVKETEHLLFGLKVRYALARVYQAQGKEGLARLEMQKLGQLDVTGQFRAATLLHG